MKAGVSCYCFNALFQDASITLPEVIEFVGKHTEAECFEPLTRFWAEGEDVNEQARRARDLLDAVGLEVSCYTLDSNFGHPDDAKVRECVDTSIERLETARILGTDTIRLDPCTGLPADAMENLDMDALLRRIASGMAEVCDAAAEWGIKVGAENHGRLVGGSEQVQRMIELVDRPNFGVNIDFTNFRNVFGEDHVAVTRQLAAHVVHAHAKDFHIRTDPQEGEEWREIPTGEYVKRAVGGEGDAQWRELFMILRDAGYQGTISLEISDPKDIRGSVATGVANIRRVLGEIGAGQ